MDQLLYAIGWYADTPFNAVGEFWSSPLGLFISAAMCITAAFNVMHPAVDDNLCDRIYYSCLSLLFLLAFAVGLGPGVQPHYIVKSLLVMLAFRNIWRMVWRWRYWRRTGRAKKSMVKETK